MGIMFKNRHFIHIHGFKKRHTFVHINNQVIMKNLLILGFLVLFSTQAYNQDKVNWLSWEEAVELSKETPKKIYVDVYTNWCGWCKKMDKSTFTDPKVIELLNAEFYAVKFNAEQKESITWNDNTFKFVKSGRRGAHELAMSLLDNRMGYPSFVLLDEDFSRIMISPGFKRAPQVMKELNFAKDEIYKTSSWEDYNAN